jgi:hypothetical protein
MTDDEPRFEEVDVPAGGWGSAQTTASLLLHEHTLLKGSRVLLHQNKPDGYACVSCSWAKPAKPHVIEACENGIKATAWETTSKRTTPEFFAQHTVTELLSWSDLDLEDQGRLTEPLRWDAASAIRSFPSGTTRKAVSCLPRRRFPSGCTLPDDARSDRPNVPHPVSAPSDRI